MKHLYLGFLEGLRYLRPILALTFFILLTLTIYLLAQMGEKTEI